MFTKKNKFLLVLMCLYSTVNAQEFSTEQCLKDLKLAADNANEVSAKILSPQNYKKALAAQGKANSTSKKASLSCAQ